MITDGSTFTYPSNANCEWMISPNDAFLITLNFTTFITQAENDVVRVYQCYDKACQSDQVQLAELSGTYSVPQAVVSVTGFMKVVFTSDSAVSADGFIASWVSVSTTCPHPAHTI
jgi:hypothetical protein